MTDPVTEWDRYREQLLRMLGGDDPVDVLTATFEEVTELISRATEAQLRQKPAPDEWSAWEVISHLTDTELVFGVRVRMMVTQDRPTLVGYDQDAWTARFAQLDGDPQTTIARWQALRQSNLAIYRSLGAEEWERVGLHSERGEETVRFTVTLSAGHDRAHIDQIRRCLADTAIAEPSGTPG